MGSARSQYSRNVFINCPFDKEYLRLFESLVFAVHDCGLVARSSLEIADSSQVRISKITGLIAECRFGIHDLSRTELDETHALPRFNMPLELGIFLGAKWLGAKSQRDKLCLVFDREPYRYQKFCSDIAGQDITAHGNQTLQAVKAVRDWLRSAMPMTVIPGGTKIHQRYEQFREELPLYCETLQQDPEELTFRDYSSLTAKWLEKNPW